MRFAGNKVFVVLTSVLVGAHVSSAVELGRSSRGKGKMFFKYCGSTSIASQFDKGMGPAGIVGSWGEEVARFKNERRAYLLY